MRSIRQTLKLLSLLMFLLVGISTVGRLHAEPSPVAIPQEIKGPELPTRELIPQTPKKDVNIEDLDLPYKPGEFVIEEDVVVPGQDANTNIEDGDVSPTDVVTPAKDQVDWSKIPFMPSRFPILRPAPDPHFK